MLLTVLPLPVVHDGPQYAVPFLAQVNASLLPVVAAVLALAVAIGTLVYAAHALGLFERSGPRRHRSTYRNVDDVATSVAKIGGRLGPRSVAL